MLGGIESIVEVSGVSEVVVVTVMDSAAGSSTFNRPDSMAATFLVEVRGREDLLGEPLLAVVLKDVPVVFLPVLGVAGVLRGVRGAFFLVSSSGSGFGPRLSLMLIFFIPLASKSISCVVSGCLEAPAIFAGGILRLLVFVGEPARELNGSFLDAGDSRRLSEAREACFGTEDSRAVLDDERRLRRSPGWGISGFSSVEERIVDATLTRRRSAPVGRDVASVASSSAMAEPSIVVRRFDFEGEASPAPLGFRSRSCIPLVLSICAIGSNIAPTAD